MYRLLWCLIGLLLIHTLRLSAQEPEKVYHALVLSAETKLPLEAVIGEGLSKEGKPLTYSLSNKQGVFRIVSAKPIVQIRLRLIGYTTKTIPAQSLVGDNPIRVELNPKVEQLREIVVSAQPIRQAGDTIRYLTNSFRSDGDRYLNDVLSKLPGVQVSESGAISYQGEAINHFYVEGRDLMGGQYTLLSRNLNIDAVSSIEVLERNQHIKALKDISRPNQAAINIRLKKKFQIKPFGEALLAGGLGDKALYRGQTTVANFSAGMQAMLNLKANNMGSLLLDELSNKIQIGGFGEKELGSISLLAPLGSTALPLKQGRYTFNRSYISSIKLLLPLSADRELKFSFSHGRERQQQERSSLHQVYLGDQLLDINEQSQYQPLVQQTKLHLNYEENSSQRYLTSELAYQRQKTYGEGDIYQSTYKHIGNEHSSDVISSKNQFLLKTSKDRIYHLFLNGLYHHSREALLYQQAKQMQLDERFIHNKLILEAKGQTSTNLWGGRLSMEAGINYSYQDIDLTIKQTSTSPYLALRLSPNEQLRLQSLSLSFKPSYSYHLLQNHLRLRIELPLIYRHNSAIGLSGKPIIEVRNLISPAFSTDYEIDDKWRISAHLRANEVDYEDLRSLLSGGYMQGYRSHYTANESYLWRENFSTLASIKYQDILHLVFGNIQLLYRHSKYNYTPEFSYTNTWSLIGFRAEKSLSDILTLSGDISKSFNRGRTTLTFRPTFTSSRSHFIQQNVAYTNLSFLPSIGIELSHKLSNNQVIIYDAKARASRSISHNYKSSWLRKLSQNLQYSFIPFKGLELRAALEYQLIEQSSNHFTPFYFGDFSLRYKFKAWEIELSATNIFNSKTYKIVNYSALDMRGQTAPLRGRELMLSLKHNF